MQMHAKKSRACMPCACHAACKGEGGAYGGLEWRGPLPVPFLFSAIGGTRAVSRGGPNHRPFHPLSTRNRASVFFVPI